MNFPMLRIYKTLLYIFAIASLIIGFFVAAEAASDSRGGFGAFVIAYIVYLISAVGLAAFAEMITLLLNMHEQIQILRQRDDTPPKPQTSSSRTAFLRQAEQRSASNEQRLPPPGGVMFDVPVIAEGTPFREKPGGSPVFGAAGIPLLAKGEVLTLVGRTADSAWVMVRYDDQYLWIDAAAVSASSKVSELAVVG